MAHLISFRTRTFDTSKERPNPINPIAGESVLTWLGGKLAEAGWNCTKPDVEDWGWYVDVEGSGASYLVGASAEPEEPGADVEWIVQVHKLRSLTDKLLRRNRMIDDDPLSAAIESVVRTETSIADVVVTKEA